MAHSVDLERFYHITLERMIEVAPYQRMMCGKVRNEGKDAAALVDPTEITTALTYMDTFTQDFILLPLMREFPFLVPAVEESTGLKEHFKHNNSDWTLIMDPIDGTALYCRGEHDYSIMVGLLHQGRFVAAIGYYPHNDIGFAAIKEYGAWRVNKHGDKTALPPISTVQHDAKNVAAHYRFIRQPLLPLAERLREKGYVIPVNDAGFGTCLSGILRVADGSSCAFIGAHMNVHDFGVGAFIVEECGGVLQRFKYSGKDDVTGWMPTETIFSDTTATGLPTRCRIIVANNQETIGRVVRDMIE